MIRESDLKLLSVFNILYRLGSGYPAIPGNVGMSISYLLVIVAVAALGHPGASHIVSLYIARNSRLTCLPSLPVVSHHGAGG